VVVEVINEVSIFAGDSTDAVPAETDMLFRAPDLLQTGRRSRARLEADDGTITRVGSNTLFSFDANSRSVNLKRGSLLFHSPEGKGGGRVVTASATASVLGTTIIVAATENGGFKLMVLEGTAQVLFADGTIYRLEAGQMTFVLPNTPTDAPSAGPAQGGEPEESEGGRVVQSGDPDNGASGQSGQSGKPGPVFNFDLDRMQEEAGLIQGFGEAVPSQSKINEAAREQARKIEAGELEATGAIIISADESETVILQVDDQELVRNNQSNITDPELARFIEATKTSVTPQTDGFAESNFFKSPGVFIPPGTVARLDDDDGENFSGFAAGSLFFKSGNLDLSPIRNPAKSGVGDRYFLGSTELTRFTGTTSLKNIENPAKIDISSLGTLDFTSGSGVNVSEPAANYIRLEFSSKNAISMENVTLQNNNGDLRVDSEGEDLNVLSSSSLNAGNRELEPPSDVIGSDAKNSIQLKGNNIKVENSSISAGNKLNLTATKQIRVNTSSISADFIEYKADEILLEGTTSSTDYAGSEFVMDGTTLVDLKNLDLTSLTTINLGAQTLILANVTFPNSGTIQLKSRDGLLAANPNSNQSAVTGKVNFISNVNVMGTPAEQFVSTAQGGTDTSGNSLIQISTISGSTPVNVVSTLD